MLINTGLYCMLHKKEFNSEGKDIYSKDAGFSSVHEYLEKTDYCH